MPNPVLTGVSPAGPFLEDDGPQLLFGDVTLTDAEGDFDGGKLVITGVTAQDVVGIRSGPYIVVFNGTVWFDPSGTGVGTTMIGAVTGGAGSPLTVTFNSAATTALIEQVIESVTYDNVSDAPTTAHSLSIDVIDAAGHSLAIDPMVHQLVTGAANPFNGLLVGNRAVQLVDLDGDGDLDLVGNGNSYTPYYLENVGSATAPQYLQREGVDNPLAGLVGGAALQDPPYSVSGAAYGQVRLVDLDGDGDLDVVTLRGGDFNTFRNLGTATTPDFDEGGDPVTLFDGISLSGVEAMEFADLDGDGDLDLILGNYVGGEFRFFERTGPAATPQFVEQTGVDNPLLGLGAIYTKSFALHDLDGDGDLDLLVGDIYGKVAYYENTGDDETATFELRTGSANPANGYVSPYGLGAYISVGDINGDGHPDFVLSRGDYRLDYMPTITGLPQPFTVTVTPQNDPLTASGLPTDVTAVEDVYTGLDLSGVSLSDPDNNNVTVVLTVDAGLLGGENAVNVTVTGAGTTTLTLTGLAANIDGYLANHYVTYLAPANANGDNVATLHVTANGGSGVVDLGTANIDVTAVNDAPVVSLGGNAVTFGENLVNAAPQLLYTSAVTVTDVDEGFAGGALTLSGLLAEDRVSIQSGGAIAFNSGTGEVSYNGVVIGIASGGAGATFTVALDADATAAGIEALIEHITYANVSDTPTASRPLDLNLSNGAGHDLATGLSFARGNNSQPILNTPIVANGWVAFLDHGGDGDLDILSGGAGVVRGYWNSGTAAAPFYDATADFTLNTPSGSYGTLADLDGDGDHDLWITTGAALAFYRNNGSDAAPVFARVTGADNPLQGVNVGGGARPVFADIDNDGDLDLILGDSFGTLRYYQNTGTGTVASFSLATTNPFADVNVVSASSPAFGDMDGDGDLDLIVASGAYNQPSYLENTGTRAAPVYVERTGAANPLPEFNSGRITVVDYDGDGDLDYVIVSNNFNRPYVVLNNSTFPYRTTVTVTAQAEGGVPTTGDDVIAGTSGADTIGGLAGADDIDGGDGDDFLDGGEGDDILTGGAGSDYLRGGAGADTMRGGLGNDTYVVTDAGDTADETGGDGIDLVMSLRTFTLGAGLENLTLTASGLNIDGTGNALDNLILGNDFDNVITGLDGADTLRGNGRNDTLYGGNGDDILDGGNQDDQLFGGAGADDLIGGIGHDRLDGGTGADDMVGGTGNDVYVVDNVGDTVTELAGGGTDTVESSITWTLADNVENLTLTGSDMIIGFGNDGRNVMIGNSGGNVMLGGGEVDTISGEGGNDSLFGGLGNDILNGGDGVDVLAGAEGSDKLTGGLGADWFLFTLSDLSSAAVERDEILDLNFAAGDVISLTSIDADTTVDGDQNFSWTVGNKFTKHAGELTLKYVASTNITTLEMDVDGDGKADFRIAITGDHSGTTGNLSTGVGDTDGGWLL